MDNKYFVVGVLPTIMLGSCMANHQDEAKDNTQPNIICVLLDDVSANEFNIYGGPGINTPVFDMMAREGVWFSTGYSQPICGPARATILTGKYAHGNLLYVNQLLPRINIHEANYTLGTAMKDAGYATAWFGKQHVDRHLLPSDFDFDHYIIARYWDGYDGPPQHLNEPWPNRTGMYGAQWYWHPGLLANGKGIPTTAEDFGPKIKLDSILSYIGRNHEKPFLLYWPTNLPHHEYSMESKIWYRPDIPEYDVDGNWTGRKIPASMASNLEFMDYATGKIIDALKESELLENTIIMVMGDNGTAGTAKARYEKDIAVHVPFFVYGPGHIKPKGRSDVLVDFTDILPTFIDLAGFDSPNVKDMHGHSFAPYLLGEAFTAREWISAQLDTARWLRTREYLIDGNGDFWYCGEAFDAKNYINLTQSRVNEHVAKKEELQRIRDLNIPKWYGK